MMNMTDMSGATAIIGVCVLVLFIGSRGRRVEWLVNFVLRAVMGAVGIYFVNMLMYTKNIEAMVGINLFTLLTSGMLGFPGIAVLYGILIFKNL